MTLLIKHGVDVNKRVAGDYNTSVQNGKNSKDNQLKQRLTTFLFRRSKPSTKLFNPQTENPESKK